MVVQVRTSLLAGEIAYFLDRLNIGEKYDYVVAIERKGMALLRMQMERGMANKSSDKPIHVLSDEALRYMPDNFLSNKSVLVFDDTVFSGHLISQVVRELEERLDASVDSACLFSYAQSEYQPTRSLYDGLSRSDYGVLRQEVIRYISSSLSHFLLLGSEQIPLKIRTKYGLHEWSRLLAMLDDILVIPTETEADERRLTIERPRFFDLESLPLHPGSITKGVVCKIRLLVAEEQAWLIPMVYPSTPLVVDERNCPLYKQEPEACLCGLASPVKQPNAFFCQSLYASTKLLARTIAILSSLIDDINVRFDEMPLENLKMIFPDARVDAFAKWVKDTLDSELRIRPSTGNFRVMQDEESLAVASDSILRKLVQHRTEWESSQLESRGQTFIASDELGLPWSSVVSDDPHLSALSLSRALDSLIDQTMVVSTVLRRQNANTFSTLWVRGMRLAGEYNYDLLRQVL